jgi:hypothetical protein
VVDMSASVVGGRHLEPVTASRSVRIRLL